MEGLEPEDAGEWLVVVHVEIDASTGSQDLSRRMPYYYLPLRKKHGLPVLPIALFLKVGLEGIGVQKYEERFGSLCPLRFEFLYV